MARDLRHEYLGAQDGAGEPGRGGPAPLPQQRSLAVERARVPQLSPSLQVGHSHRPRARPVPEPAPEADPHGPLPGVPAPAQQEVRTLPAPHPGHQPSPHLPPVCGRPLPFSLSFPCCPVSSSPQSSSFSSRAYMPPTSSFP